MAESDDSVLAIAFRSERLRVFNHLLPDPTRTARPRVQFTLIMSCNITTTRQQNLLKD